MKTNILRIRFELFGSVLFAVIAYAVSVNMEIGFFEPNWWWMSNNFALTVSGGVFTGFLVALLSEVREYEEKKVEVESQIVYNAREVYKLLGKIHNKAHECLENADIIFEENIFQREEKELDLFVNNLREIESTTRWLLQKDDERKRTSLIKIALINFGFFDQIEMARIKIKMDRIHNEKAEKLRGELEKIKENAIFNMHEIEINLRNFSEN